MKIRTMSAILASAVLSACASAFSDNTTTAGASVFQFDYESVDLVQLLDPDGAAAKKKGKAWSALDEGQQIDLAFEEFYRSIKQPGADSVERRNRVQDRLMGASQQLCHQYQQYMQNLHSSGNFAFGLLTTATAAAGALVTGGTSQILSGAAAAISGTRAEFNQDYFYEEAVPTIMKGIKVKRDESAAAITTRRGNAKTYAQYTVEQAIADTIEYHKQCSLVAGVQELSKLANIAEDAGLERLRHLEEKARQQEMLYSRDQDPTGALVQLKQSAEAAGADFATSIASLTRWPKKADEASQKMHVDLAKEAASARVLATTSQLDACQASAFKHADEIQKARVQLSAAKSEADQKVAGGALERGIMASEGFIKSIEPAYSMLKLDLDALVKELTAADQAARPENEMPPEIIGPINRLNESTTRQKQIVLCPSANPVPTPVVDVPVDPVADPS